MKDLFSSGSELYRQARPQYSQAVLDEVLRHVSQRELAWDCGAGPGQFTQMLAPFFKHVMATDLSAAQLAQAPQFSNVTYQAQPAEHSTLESASVDLVTVAQAIHWFSFDAFYAEVRRVLKPDGVIVVLGYGLIQLQNTELNQRVHHLYSDILGKYWDAERRYIDENYQTIPFPFKELQTPEICLEYQWSGQQLLDYLNTWSALKHYQKAQEQNPQMVDALAEIQHFLHNRTELWHVTFPVLLRTGMPD